MFRPKEIPVKENKDANSNDVKAQADAEKARIRAQIEAALKRGKANEAEELGCPWCGMMSYKPARR